MEQNHHHQMRDYLWPTYTIKESKDLVKNLDGVKFLPYLLELKPLHEKENDTNCKDQICITECVVKTRQSVVTRIKTITRKGKKDSLVKCSSLNGLEVGEDWQVRHVFRPWLDDQRVCKRRILQFSPKLQPVRLG